MNRKLRRAAGIEKKVATYNFTEEQLEAYFLKRTEKEKNKIIAECLTLLLVLPMEVLMDHYWKKTYAKKIPEFTKHVLDYYTRWEQGELDMEEMKKDLWEYGGVRLEVNEDE